MVQLFYQFLQTSLSYTGKYGLHVVVMVCIYSEAECLIGLRPPRQDPRYQDAQRLVQGVNNKTATISSGISQHLLAKELRLSVNFTDSQSSCRLVPLLRCTYRFLHKSLTNQSTSCHNTNDFITCAKSVVRSEGRRSFVSALPLITDLTSQAQIYLGCDQNNYSQIKSGHTRHERTKRSSSQCCTHELLKCAVQTVTKLFTIHPTQQCHIIGFYNSCVRTFEDLCDSRTVLTTFEILKLQLQRSC